MFAEPGVPKALTTDIGDRLGQLLFLDHDRLAAVGLVALRLIVALDRLAGLGIDEDAADAMAGPAVDDVEGDALGGRGGGVQGDRADELPRSPDGLSRSRGVP